MQDNKDNKDNNKFQDRMKAWIMIQVTGQTSVNFLNKKKLAKELEENLEAFGTDPKELWEFAEYFIDSCLSSRSYTTTFFGTIPMSSEGGAKRLAQDIEDVTKNIPGKFGLEEKGALLRQALFSAYRNKLEFGEKVLDELGIDVGAD